MVTWELRAAFARSLSDMYGREVPAYTALLDVAHEVNSDVMAADPAAAQRLGSIGRVTAERHGAIRLGTPTELSQVARVFGALGMYPVGFYDLRDAGSSAIPVVSTAFRPVDADELARNPLRVFTSVLTPGDRRFFSADLQVRLEEFLGRRRIFSPDLLALSDRAESGGGLDATGAEEFLRLATATFELSPEPVDRAWYAELERVSAVAADIGGVTSTHINHLTPRVLDIDALYERMSARGITMIDDVQGPPRWDGPDLLLRQTSFRALAEPRAFRMPDGEIVLDSLRVRFGEVEARGIALTRAGRERYDAAIVEARERADAGGEPDAMAGAPRGGGVGRVGGVGGVGSVGAAGPVGAAGSAAAAHRQGILREIWARDFPRTEAELDSEGLAYFTYDAAGARTPIVYEDFLPASAAGIFASNLTDRGAKDSTQEAATLDADWLAGALGRDLLDPFDLYAAQSEASRARTDEGPR
ncbi:VOC family protein [Occultella glacieicola]|uniref:2-oxoadipate dioxygenase/decarboxylase n=1 Tax=Occultella glacieicola TaxID=2518684 RepID=A0ABY2E535_9MICO|nr:VOC family protein [Occultella glacieicola]TDE95149.1 VOC family protein [Occultella glacieicola]